MNQLVECMEFKAQICESRSNGNLVVRGVFQRANTPNKNNRVYPDSVWESCLAEKAPFIQAIAERRAFGELEHPKQPGTSLQRASHIVTKIWREGDAIMGEAEILPTPNGQILKVLLENGCTVGISSRGDGTAKPGANGHDIVEDGFQLKAFDMVADPSTFGAYPAPVNESIEHIIKTAATSPELGGLRESVTKLSTRVSDDLDIRGLVSVLSESTSLYQDLSKKTGEEAAELRGTVKALQNRISESMLRVASGGKRGRYSETTKEAVATIAEELAKGSETGVEKNEHDALRMLATEALNRCQTLEEICETLKKQLRAAEKIIEAQATTLESLEQGEELSEATSARAKIAKGLAQGNGAPFDLTPTTPAKKVLNKGDKYAGKSTEVRDDDRRETEAESVEITLDDLVSAIAEALTAGHPIEEITEAFLAEGVDQDAIVEACTVLDQMIAEQGEIEDDEQPVLESTREQPQGTLTESDGSLPPNGRDAREEALRAITEGLDEGASLSESTSGTAGSSAEALRHFVVG